jgi:hypothetical protein
MERHGRRFGRPGRCAWTVTPVTAFWDAPCSGVLFGRPRNLGSKMINWRRRRGLRLETDLEAEKLTSERGGEAYSVARRRADEASNETMAMDWSVVAFVIARKTRKAPHYLDDPRLALSPA